MAHESRIDPYLSYTPEGVMAALRRYAKTDYGVGSLRRIDDWYALTIYPAISDQKISSWLDKAGAFYGGQIKATDFLHGHNEERSIIKFRMDVRG
jgi:hypothetical protein